LDKTDISTLIPSSTISPTAFLPILALSLIVNIIAIGYIIITAINPSNRYSS
jgi:hypothetical protein